MQVQFCLVENTFKILFEQNFDHFVFESQTRLNVDVNGINVSILDVNHSGQQTWQNRMAALLPIEHLRKSA